MQRMGLRMVVAVLAIMVGGCAGQQVRTNSSVVEYLYPKEKAAVVQPSIPHLILPLKVGIAFVPEQRSSRQGMNMWAGAAGGGALTEQEKMALLNKVADHFKSYEFVKSIEVIPSAYLTPKGGFDNLDQIKTMYGVDVIALVSYDQVQFTDEGMLSLTYWTLVGAYVVSGEKNDTSTMMDTVVYDIASRKMLFRAPGLSRVQGSATAINLSEKLRKDSVESFRVATDDMVSNLDIQLAAFKEKVKAQPEAFHISHSATSGGGGGGALDLMGLVLLAAAAGVARRVRW
jgi:rhombotail lipoprotein